MCGICGIIRFDRLEVRKGQLKQMMERQKHRGPDDQGVFAEDQAGLGFVRLSILDLSKAGNQPMFSADQRYVMVYNGEIFNYIELRNELMTLGHFFHTGTDTEVLLAAYQQWGEACLDRLNGMWAFAIYDRTDGSLFAARDRYGIKPFYYYQTEQMIAFASEIPPLLGLLPGKPSPDYQRIFEFLVFNRTDQTTHTFFQEVRKLQHGCKIRIIDGKVQISRWYDLKERVSASSGFESPAEFRQVFSQAVGLRLRSDVPVGVCLSGGLDSSSIVSVLLHDHKKRNLKTFSAVYNNGQHGDESEYISEYRSQVRYMYKTTPNAESLERDLDDFVSAHGEPVPSTSPYAQFKVMELAKGKVVVTLDGQGADEELAGYHYFFGYYLKDLLRQGNFMRMSSESLHYMLNHKSLYGIKTFLYFHLPEKMRTSARVSEKGYLMPGFAAEYDGPNAIAGALYGANSLKEALLAHFEYKLEHLLKWEDRNSMWFSLEARVPFLDHHLVERILATDSNMIIRNGNTKYLLREAMNGSLPESIRKRHDKIGFGTPQAEWFRSPRWQQLITDLLKSESFRNRGIIQPEKALSLYGHHLRGKNDISREIWKWIHLELWFRKFID